MFGHKSGRVEREIRELLNQMNVQTLQQYQIPVAVRVKYNEIVQRIDKLIALSGKVHDLIDEEL